MLDTNICIYIMKQQPASVAQRFAQCRQGEVVISAITLAELEYGVHCSSEATQPQNRRALDALIRVIPAVFLLLSQQHRPMQRSGPPQSGQKIRWTS